MKSPRTCPYCDSLIVAWNYVFSYSNHSPYEAGWDHECWDCEKISSTLKSIEDGVPYESLSELSKLQKKLRTKLKWSKTLEILYGDKK